MYKSFLLIPLSTFIVFLLAACGSSSPTDTLPNPLASFEVEYKVGENVISWYEGSSNTPNNGVNVLGWRIYRSIQSPSGEVSTPSLVAESRGESFSDTQIEHGVSYVYSISVVGKNGETKATTQPIPSQEARLFDIAFTVGKSFLAYNQTSDIYERTRIGIRAINLLPVPVIYKLLDPLGNTVVSGEIETNINIGIGHYREHEVISGDYKLEVTYDGKTLVKTLRVNAIRKLTPLQNFEVIEATPTRIVIKWDTYKHATSDPPQLSVSLLDKNRKGLNKFSEAKLDGIVFERNTLWRNIRSGESLSISATITIGEPEPELIDVDDFTPRQVDSLTWESEPFVVGE